MLINKYTVSSQWHKNQINSIYAAYKLQSIEIDYKLIKELYKHIQGYKSSSEVSKKKFAKMEKMEKFLDDLMPRIFVEDWEVAQVIIDDFMEEK